MMKLFRRLFGSSTDEESPSAASVTQMPVAADSPEAMTTSDERREGPLQTRPLPPPRAFITNTRRVLYGLASDVGQSRSNNQDASLAFMAVTEMVGSPPAIGFFIVADGMGGHHDGELASAVTVQTLSRRIVDEIVMPHFMGIERTADQKTIPEVLADSMDAANTMVQERVPNGGGTTATCTVIRGDLAYIAHVGDSRAYLVSDGNLELITRDHSLVQRLVELGQITPEEAKVHPQRNVLYRAIGQGETLEVDAATRRLPPSSRLLLCSDGLWGVIGDEKIGEILAECSDPQEACDRMIAAANGKGGPDNITAVLVQMPD